MISSNSPKSTFVIPLLLLILCISCSNEGPSEPQQEEITHLYKAFESERIAFGSGFNQSVSKKFSLFEDASKIKQVSMFVKLRCPSEGCNAWDVYANIKVKDKTTGNWYEIGRFITPYGVDNSSVDRGFEIDVTDFKSLLTGDDVELLARIETWGPDGWVLSLEFDFIEGKPDYPYYAIERVLEYNDWSFSGVPYGINHEFNLQKDVSIPSNAEATHLRTIITGWGHATPNDVDGRPCAEWCFRTHEIEIDGNKKFTHSMEPIGCASNLINTQKGNWQPDRAGWCPGMAVPVRIDKFDNSMQDETFSFEYDFEDWKSDESSKAYYAISTFVVVKSNTPVSKPTVTD